MRPIPIQPEPHQESVWDYPRPARLEDTAKHLIVICNQITIAETTGGKRVLETSHPPSYYFPAAAVQCQYLVPNRQRGICDGKVATNTTMWWWAIAVLKLLPGAFFNRPRPSKTLKISTALVPREWMPATLMEKKSPPKRVIFMAVGLPLILSAPLKEEWAHGVGKRLF